MAARHLGAGTCCRRRDRLGVWSRVCADHGIRRCEFDQPFDRAGADFKRRGCWAARGGIQGDGGAIPAVAADPNRVGSVCVITRTPSPFRGPPPPSADPLPLPRTPLPLPRTRRRRFQQCWRRWRVGVSSQDLVHQPSARLNRRLASRPMPSFPARPGSLSAARLERVCATVNRRFRRQSSSLCAPLPPLPPPLSPSLPLQVESL